ncbi:exodeoxyribonuclease VII large subunit [Acetobacteraceae bacterium ESL0697]|nr:exodeoxyribonuclease VII large subunit [Acetobacteraceae bacterium ESL0697]
MADESVSKLSNITEYSVSDISGAIKRTLEGAFGRVRVRGEITELKRYPSGHIYLSLKDESAKISGVIWRGSVSRLGLSPENGNEVIATGRISSYGERSSYQLIIDRMEFAGEGALLARIEQLKRRFQQEGLFDQERKKSLPFLPRRIGVITSRSGAVLHDICTTLARRFPCEVILWPVAVQGEGAAQQIVAALEGIVQGPEAPDVLIVARGGGSLEDLMAFNEEAVIRAVAACPVPVISAVGHETDTTLIDFVSDRRAPTPTAAAEMAMPLRSELVADLVHRTARLVNGFVAIRQRWQMRLDRLVAALPDLPSLLDMARMRLDDRSQRLALALPAQMVKARAALNDKSCALPSLDFLLEKKEAAFAAVREALGTVWRQFLQNEQMKLLRVSLRPEILKTRLQLERTRLQGVERHLVAVSPRAILERGYVMVQDSEGSPVTASASLGRQALVRLHFSDGKREAMLDPEFSSISESKKKSHSASRVRKSPAQRKGKQGELEL